MDNDLMLAQIETVTKNQAIGLYISQFDPLTSNDERAIYTALSDCSVVAVIVFDPNASQAARETRATWIKNIYGDQVKVNVSNSLAQSDLINTLGDIKKNNIAMYGYNKFHSQLATDLGITDYVNLSSTIVVLDEYYSSDVHMYPYDDLASFHPVVRAFYLPRVVICGEKMIPRRELGNKLANTFNGHLVPHVQDLMKYEFTNLKTIEQFIVTQHEWNNAAGIVNEQIVISEADEMSIILDAKRLLLGVINTTTAKTNIEKDMYSSPQYIIIQLDDSLYSKQMAYYLESEDLDHIVVKNDTNDMYETALTQIYHRWPHLYDANANIPIDNKPVSSFVNNVGYL